MGDHLHATRFRKLAGVADQVNQDLTQTSRIGFDSFRDRALPREVKAELLFSESDAHQRDNFGKNLVRRCVSLLELQLSRFNLGKVEDIVDHIHQVLATGIHGRQHFGAFIA